ncbi:hypothetical protein IVB15_20065 [Bradyrhizobium sp. 182]|uniref:hypothetical protein n=1 Tax=Bradyrhizobium sp. 182 TaxID=2782651 RepID=UPI001FF8FBF5|nr:hypothetical protein [Bradyrhizobium sp. 182]MCK1529950.1 hypothetical protein [Bradyrhizobium sp. 182]
MNTQVTAGLRHRHPTFPDQLDCLDLRKAEAGDERRKFSLEFTEDPKGYRAGKSAIYAFEPDLKKYLYENQGRSLPPSVSTFSSKRVGGKGSSGTSVADRKA